MTPRSLLLCALALSSLLSSAWSNPMCNNECCRFVEGFPARLKKLREHYLQIRDYYEASNDLDTALLDQSVEDSLKSDFACQVMDSILDFYLSKVLPTAITGVTDDTKDLMPHVESIQEIFHDVKAKVTKCRNYFSCKKQFDIQTLNSSYIQMNDRGIYKAMSELDVLFNHIESYLASKRHKNLVASA